VTLRLRWQGLLARHPRSGHIALALAGALSALGFAPFYWLPCPAVGLTLFLWATLGATRRRQATLRGLSWGWGFFLAGNYWIANSFLVEADRFAWMIPLMVGGLALFLSFYPAIIALLCWSARPRPAIQSWLLFAVLWTGAEYARGHILTGYPWNLLAYVWGFSALPMQGAALVGSWGMSLTSCLLLTAAVLAEPLGARRALAVAAGLLALILAPGVRLWLHPVEDTAIRLRLVQPALPEAERVTGRYAWDHLAILSDLTRAPAGGAPVQAVIWPEAAIEMLIERDADLRSLLGGLAPRNGYLLTGAVHGVPLTGPLDKIWNSLAVIDDRGVVQAFADKAHLVPLGEYVPGRSWLPFIDKVTPGALDFSSGQGHSTVTAPGLPPFTPLICYEVIFPGEIIDSDHRPAWLLNITNDGWFGDSTGPYQHFASARFRAVEEGLPLIRVANTGISAVIDPLGRIRTKLDLNTRAVRDVFLPKMLDSTPFSWAGVWPTLGIAIMVIVTFFWRGLTKVLSLFMRIITRTVALMVAGSEGGKG
jgi:apolipoprotein N-acyltransferase